MVVGVVIGVCVLLLILAFVVPALSRHPERGARKTAGAGGREHDVYDDRAHHYLLAHVPTGAWAGCVRVVPGPGQPYEPMFADVPVDLATVPAGEISRLTIAREFRRRPDHRPPAMLHAALTAVAAVMAIGLPDAVCVMEPHLAAKLNTVGIHLRRISPLIHHRGDRALFHLNPTTTSHKISPELQELLTTIRSQLAVSQLTSEVRTVSP